MLKLFRIYHLTSVNEIETGFTVGKLKLFGFQLLHRVSGRLLLGEVVHIDIRKHSITIEYKGISCNDPKATIKETWK